MFPWKISPVVVLVILQMCARKSLACRLGKAMADLSSRIPLEEEVLISPSDGSCMSVRSGTDHYGKILSSHSTSQSQDIFNIFIHCEYTMESKLPFQRVMLDFRWFDVSRRYLTDPTCEHASVTFYDGPDGATSPVLRNATCGSQRPALLTSSQSALSMQIYASGNLSVVDFVAVYSSFSNDTFCNSSEQPEERILCQSTNRCIPKDLSCDRQGVSNCGDEDFSDQVNEIAPAFCPVTHDIDWTPLLITVACIAALSIPLLLYWCCWRPGYIPWLCCTFRRRRCCELGGSCTTPSRHLCRRACSCRGYAGCTCTCCPGAVGPQPGKKPSSNPHRPRKVGRAELIPRSRGRRHVDSPSNVFVIMEDAPEPNGEKGRKQQKPVLKKEALHVAVADHRPHPRDHGNTGRYVSPEEKSPNSPQDIATKPGSAITKNKPFKIYPIMPVNLGSETMKPMQGPLDVHGDPSRRNQGFAQDDVGGPPAFTPSKKMYSDGGHVREGR
ncbi:uncharacterized protein LOC110988669 [Acanthaster planci]|uniref:Uncharacterized protein LOC110988669 n=1 Tax=Acanthaster planci TaxID=133434 RepID=A0A8B7ZRT5_ACAPL|nr:uncharacterized protein LOC110988669 [Acanthaster planci]